MADAWRQEEDAPWDAAEAIGSQIGPYEIVRLLGEGGQGRVYLARHRESEFHHRVALKILRPDLVTPAVRARFRQERSILSGIEHPNIARFLDGGSTDDGRLYFVMEAVIGQPIDAYCDRHHLSLDQRLDLFCQAAAAVQRVHHQEIIHRDIKASNILVTDDGVPKLLDFGIAKMLQSTHNPQITHARRPPMTPAAASPEQILGRPLTTATDVYSLGLLLYRLLTGRPAYDLTTGGRHTWEQKICDDDPPLPSSHGGAPLRGDLDAIMLQALNRAPEDRYTSVEGLIEDIRRYRAHLPVTAHSTAWPYRVAKFIRRHRRAVTGVVASLVLLLATWTFFTLRVQTERDRALEIKSLLRTLLEEANPNANQGEGVQLETLVDQAALQLSELKSQPSVQAEMQTILGSVLMALGRHDRARPLLLEALQTRRARHRRQHPEIVEVLQLLGRLELEQGHFEDAFEYSSTGLAMAEDLGLRRHATVADLHQDQVEIQLSKGDLDRGHFHAGQALAIHQNLRNGLFPTPQEALDEMQSLDALAIVHFARKDYRRAEVVFRRGVHLMNRVDLPDHHVAATLLSNRAAALRRLDRWDEAEAALLEAIRIDRKLLGDKSLRLGIRLLGLGNLLRRRGRIEEAITTCEQALHMTLELRGEEHPNVARIRRCLEKAAAARSTEAQGQPQVLSAPVRINNLERK